MAFALLGPCCGLLHLRKEDYCAQSLQTVCVDCVDGEPHMCRFKFHTDWVCDSLKKVLWTMWIWTNKKESMLCEFDLPNMPTILPSAFVAKLNFSHFRQPTFKSWMAWITLLFLLFLIHSAVTYNYITPLHSLFHTVSLPPPYVLFSFVSTLFQLHSLLSFLLSLPTLPIHLFQGTLSLTYNLSQSKQVSLITAYKCN